MGQRPSPQVRMGRTPKALRGSDRPRPDQGAQRDPGKLVLGRLVHEDDGQDDGPSQLVDVGDCAFNRVAGREDVVDDQGLFSLRRRIVRGKGATLPVALLARPVDHELLAELLADQRGEGDAIDRDADHPVRIDLALLHLLQGDVGHRRGHEPDPVAVDADGPPPDLHVFRGLPALHPARQEPGDRLGGQVQLVRDLLLGEALLLVLEGPLRDRVHVFHPFTRSNSRDAACRISRYRTRVDALFARLVRATPFDGLRNAFILYSNGSRMYFIGRDPAGIAGGPLALTTDRAQTGTRPPLLSPRYPPNSSDLASWSPGEIGPSQQTSLSSRALAPPAGAPRPLCGATPGTGGITAPMPLPPPTARTLGPSSWNAFP